MPDSLSLAHMCFESSRVLPSGRTIPLNQQLLPVLSRQLLSHMAAKQKPQALTLAWSDEDGIVMVFDAQAEGEPPCAVS